LSAGSDVWNWCTDSGAAVLGRNIIGDLGGVFESPVARRYTGWGVEGSAVVLPDPRRITYEIAASVRLRLKVKGPV